jgi:hypothetical protein
MTSLICQTCNGDGAILRPQKLVMREIWRDAEKVFVQDKSGGLDACPACAALAHAQWQAATLE